MCSVLFCIIPIRPSTLVCNPDNVLLHVNQNFRYPLPPCCCHRVWAMSFAVVDDDDDDVNVLGGVYEGEFELSWPQ